MVWQSPLGTPNPTDILGQLSHYISTVRRQWGLTWAMVLYFPLSDFGFIETSLGVVHFDWWLTLISRAIEMMVLSIQSSKFVSQKKESIFELGYKKCFLEKNLKVSCVIPVEK